VSHTVVEGKSDILYKSTILIVDDEASARDTMEIFLFGDGYDLAFASSGREALKKAAELIPDLILLDVMMPGMDGFEVCQRLRADPVLAEVPIILVTALDDRDSRLRGIEAGADDFVSKPIDRTKFMARVRSITRLNRYRRLLDEQERRQRAEEALQESEARSRRLFEDVPLGLYRTSPEGYILEANAALVQMLGYPDREALPATNVVDAYLDPEQRERWQALMEREGVVRSFEVRLRRCDGTIIWVRDMARPILDDEGRVLYYEGSFEDVTERKRAEEALRHVDRLQVLDELDRALASTLDPEEIAEITLRRVSTALDAPMGVLFMLPPQGIQCLEKVCTLNQGWVELAAPDKALQHLQILLQRLQGNRGIISLSGDELITLDGRPGLAQRQGSEGMAIPIWSDEELIAAMALGGWPADWSFADDDRALARAAAGRAGQVIRNARLYQSSRRQSARLTTLNTVSAAAVSSLDLDIALRQVLELTCQALDAVGGSILVLDPGAERLVLVLALADETSDLRGQHLSLGQSIAGWVAQHGQAVHVADVHQDARWHDGIDAIAGFETRSRLCAPLKHRGKTNGVIEIVNKRQGDFTGEDLNLLEAVSSIAAAALENARLYEAIRARASELALLNEIGLALTSTLDYATVVHAALNQIQRLFRANNVSLLQPDPQTGDLCFVKSLSGTTPVEIPVRIAPEESTAGWALDHHRSVLVEDVQTDPRFMDWMDHLTGCRAGALMAVPLLARERFSGVILVISSEAGIYTHEDLSTLQAVASTLAVALENAGLYDELRTLLREWEEAQVQLIHAEKMTALGRLAASIAHEINNPLQAVQTYLTLAQEQLAQDPTGALGRYLSTVNEEIERIATIVRRMRDFYRPASDGMRATHLQAILESVLALTNKQLQHSHITVECAWSDDLPEIEANPDHLKQVFLNLVLNAIDAMSTGGTLQITTGLDQVQDGAGQEPLLAARIEFSDTGKGMPPEALSRLFEPFFTTKDGGTGLGLSISYGIIQAHGGQITVESHAEMGTTFTILLPVSQPLAGQESA
jgi:two-component system NtrC family sensor kinase